MPEKGLIMDLCWIELVLLALRHGRYDRRTPPSGPVWLVQEGSLPWLSGTDELEQHRDKHQVQDLRMFDSKPRLFAWELARPCKFTEAVEYDASRAGQRWISLRKTVLAKKPVPARTEDASHSSSGSEEASQIVVFQEHSRPKAVSHASSGSMLRRLRCLERRETAGEGLDQDTVESDLLSAGQASFCSFLFFKVWG